MRQSIVRIIGDAGKNIKLQHLLMPSEALFVEFFDNHIASFGIDGGAGCNFIFFA